MIDLESVVATGLVTLCMSFIGSYIMWSLAGPRVVVRAIQSRMGPILMDWLTAPTYKTGKKRVVTDDEGGKTEVDEVLSPLQLIIINAGELMWQKMMGKMGGDARKRGAVQSDIVDGISSPGNPFGGLLNQINPRLLERAIKDGDYVPIILEQLGPLLKDWAAKKLNPTNVM